MASAVAPPPTRPFLGPALPSFHSNPPPFHWLTSSVTLLHPAVLSVCVAERDGHPRPGVVARVFSSAKAGNGFNLSLFPVQCALQWGYYQQFYAYVALPLLAAAASVLGYSLWYLWLRRRVPKSEITTVVAAAHADADDDNPTLPPTTPRSANDDAATVGTRRFDSDGKDSIASVDSTRGVYRSESELRHHAINRAGSAIVVLLFLMHDKISDVRGHAHTTVSLPGGAGPSPSLCAHTPRCCTHPATLLRTGTGLSPWL